MAVFTNPEPGLPYRVVDPGAVFGYLAEEEISFGDAVQYGTADGKVKRLTSNGVFAGIAVFEPIPHEIAIPPSKKYPVNSVVRVAKRSGWFVKVLDTVAQGERAKFLIKADGTRGFVGADYEAGPGETVVDISNHVMFASSAASGGTAKVEISVL